MTPGTKLGPYELLAPIGAGGMGEVWKARDTRLDRIVALKISKTEFTQRFERETRAIAALNHPHICQLYDVGPNYLVMEYVEGAELRGPMPVEKAVELAGQILEALDAAHRKGIVHRDLKPANILVTKAGVKVLDFGLAKMQAQAAAVGADTPTAVSVEGTISGTLFYMAPEQLAGKTDVDSRADIFAFGCVLYEMLTGKRAFEGSNAASVIAAVMERPAPSVVEVAPAPLDRVLKRCLEKDRDERWQTARDLKWQLARTTAEGAEAGRVTKSARMPWIVTGIFAGMFGLAMAGLALLYFREKPAQTRVVRSTIQPPENATFSTPYADAIALPALSPDGQRIAFAAHTRDRRTQLWIRSLDSVNAQPLAGTDDASFPFWSPDGKSIGFFAKGKLNRIDASGGPVLALADAGYGRGASWSSQGVIVFGRGSIGVLHKVSATGGAVSDAGKLSPGETTQRWPWFLPDGKHFLFAAGFPGVSGKIIRLGSLDSTESTKLLEADSDAIYSAGYILFLRLDTLVAQPFDPSNLRLSVETLPVAEHVQSNQISSLGAFSASVSGLLAYAGGSAERELGWFDRKGNRIGSLGDAAQFNRLHFSPDRKNLAVSMTTGSNTDIWLYDVARGLPRRFTFDPASELEAAWSSDGRTIVFNSSRRGHFDLYRKSANGSEAEEPLYIDSLEKYPTSISPDGKFLLYYTFGDPKTGSDLWILPDPLGPPGTAKPYSLLQSLSNETNAQFSLDGHWIAYDSNETGRSEIYVTAFPGPGAKRQISTSGGLEPRWRADGKEIFYIALDQKLMAAEVIIKKGEIQTGEVRPLFGPMLTGGGFQYDVSADGQRVLAVTPRSSGSEPLTIVQNWTAGLKK
jgi:Tol biopolymer transport system component/tRNA A-37 threonylcarbamoyl transferase component Bud32